MAKTSKEDSIKVFINCPYDDDYESFFRALVFGIIANGFIVKCAKEITGGGTRIDKILQMIAECGYGIHDISRIEIDKTTHFPRFNMAFELGVFIGCQNFGEDCHKNKDYLILDIDSYRYRDFLSDISGKDPVGHNGCPETALYHVNNWLGQKRINESGNQDDYTGSQSISDFYEEFKGDFQNLCKQSHANISKLAHHEYILITSKWLKRKKEMEDEKRASSK